MLLGWWWLVHVRVAIYNPSFLWFEAVGPITITGPERNQSRRSLEVLDQQYSGAWGATCSSLKCHLWCFRALFPNMEPTSRFREMGKNLVLLNLWLTDGSQFEGAIARRTVVALMQRLFWLIVILNAALCQLQRVIFLDQTWVGGTVVDTAMGSVCKAPPLVH